MDPAQTKALAAIQPFVHHAAMTKTPSPRFLTDLITRATSAPGTYVFTELLQTSSIQSLRAADTPPESRAYLILLEMFSWGTYDEYQSTPNLPALTEAQTFKLRQLSLLTLASPFAPTNPTTNSLTYASLLSALGLPDAASLESLVTSAIYSGLLTARLSPTSTPPTVHITSVAPLRDLRPQSLPALVQILSTWESRCASVIADLESQIGAIRSTASARSALQRKRQETVDAAVLNEKTPSPTENTDSERKQGKPKAQRLGSKRDLDEQMEGELDDLSDDDGRMDLDEGLGDVGPVGAGRGTMAGGSSRGAKRNRGRG